ncbi:MAG: hypothetical protein GX444_17970 [Myxococcales bacterium]|nr:hypothetical protein [Myxococcales bacterium]
MKRWVFVAFSFLFALTCSIGPANAASPQKRLSTMHISSSTTERAAGAGRKIVFEMKVFNGTTENLNVSLDYSDLQNWEIDGPSTVAVPGAEYLSVEFEVALPTATPPGNDIITVTATAGSTVDQLEFLARLVWDQVNSLSPPRILSNIIWDPNRRIFYLIGGYDENTIYGLGTYDPDADAYNDGLAQPAVPTAVGGSCLLNDRLYLVGGTADFNWGTDYLQIYDIPGDSWSFGPEVGDPSGGLMATTAVCDPERGRVYVIGGADNDNYTPSQEVFYFDVEADEWVRGEAANYPNFPEYLRAVYDHDTLRVIGSESLVIYDIEANEWSAPEYLPAGRMDSAYGIYGKTEVIAGGWQFGGVGDIAPHNTAIYRKLDGKEAFQFLDQLLPQPLGPTAGAFDDQGRFFVFGGFCRDEIFCSQVSVVSFPVTHDGTLKPSPNIAYDDGECDTGTMMVVKDLPFVQALTPVRYPVRLKSVSWLVEDAVGGNSQVDVVIYHDGKADGVPSIFNDDQGVPQPVYRQNRVPAGATRTWGSLDLSAIAAFQEPIQSGEWFVGFEFNYPVRSPYICFDQDAAPVDHTWYYYHDEWVNYARIGKSGVLMVRAEVEYEDLDDDTAGDDDDNDDNDDNNDDSDPSDDDQSDDDADDDRSAAMDDDSDDNHGCGC